MHLMSGHEAEQFRPVALHPLLLILRPISEYDRAYPTIFVHLPLSYQEQHVGLSCTEGTLLRSKIGTSLEE